MPEHQLHPVGVEAGAQRLDRVVRVVDVDRAGDQDEAVEVSFAGREIPIFCGWGTGDVPAIAAYGLMRAAVFYTPAPGSALARLADGWLGRDAFTSRATRPADPKRDSVVADPARYGFHATLKAPFPLADGANLDGVARRLRDLCRERAVPTIQRLMLAQLGPFFALVPADPEPGLAMLEADVLRTFEPYRAPLDAAAVAKRRPDRLTPRQLEHLHRWGYPFVLDEFRFHMTLTGQLRQDTNADGADAVRRDLEAHFTDVVGRPLRLDGLALFVEPEPGAPFHVHAYHPFGPRSAPSSPAVP